MRVLVAIDSLKGSLSSSEAGGAVKCGILKAFPEAFVEVVPVADGGEGTVEALVDGLNGQMVETTVSDPLGRNILARYGVIGDLAVMEMAAAAGLPLLSKAERDPLNTTTYGVGQMIGHALDRGCRHFLIGIGGSATNDGGVGMLQALGFEFKDQAGNEIAFGAKGLRNLSSVCTNGARAELGECTFRIACDVNNPLCGENGCSAVFAEQKGASDEAVKQMDNWLLHYAEITKSVLPRSDAQASGAGAAGGLGFAFDSYLGATLEPGVRIVSDVIGLEKKIQNADLVITGEGKLDRQSVMGKTPMGVAELAQKYNKPVIALAGSVSRDVEVCNAKGLDACFSILQGVVSLEEAMNKDTAKYNLEITAQQLFRLIGRLGVE